jgi:hypothetical protein
VNEEFGVVRRIVLLAFVALLVLVACGGDDDPARTPAGEAQVGLLEDLYNGRFSEAYDDLHPSHQNLVPRALFIRCARETIPVGQLDSIEILDVFDEKTKGLSLGDEPSKGVRIKLTFSDGQTIGPYVSHAVKDGDRWRWVLNKKAIEAYKADRCPR